MVTVFLVRHATHDLLGKTLCGRMEGVGLNEAGRRQAASLAKLVRARGLDAVYTSPLQRTRETAEFLSPAAQICDAMTEIDFGAWTGRSFASLEDDPQWRLWNSARTQAQPPGGETIAQVRQRAMQTLAAFRTQHTHHRIAIVSHADTIKTVLANMLGMTLDDWWRFEISPASISTLALWEDGGKVLSMNETVAP